jgi:hypothetical protein
MVALWRRAGIGPASVPFVEGARMSVCPFSVIESRWWSSGNHSVRGLFEAVAAIHYDNPSAFAYDMFADKSSLRTVLGLRGHDSRTEVVYLASHGDHAHIVPNGGDAISRAEVRAALTAANPNAQIRGLFLGACLIGNTDVARYFLERRETHLDWVAGYGRTVDWVDGSAIDMIFFSKLAQAYTANARRRKADRESARHMAHTAATALVRLVQGAHSAYGFNIYFHENNRLTSMFNE